MKRRTIIPSKDIQQVISERLKLQSTQRNLEQKFKHYIPSLISLRSIADAFGTWDKDKQSDFIIALGGPVNYDKTAKYVAEIVKTYRKPTLELA